MRATWRIAFVGLALLAMLGVLGLRLWVVQVTAAVEYQEQAAQNQIRLVSTPAPRGDIYDRNGTLMAGTRPSLAAVVDLALVAEEDHEELVSRLAALFDIPASGIAERLVGCFRRPDHSGGRSHSGRSPPGHGAARGLPGRVGDPATGSFLPSR